MVLGVLELVGKVLLRRKGAVGECRVGRYVAGRVRLIWIGDTDAPVGRAVMLILAVGWRQAKVGSGRNSTGTYESSSTGRGRAAGERVGCKWPTQAAETPKQH